MTEPYVRDGAALADLATFTRLVVDSGDLEPWAAVLAHLHSTGVLDVEHAHWMTVLYNTYDDLGVAWQIDARWPSPAAWDSAPDRGDVAKYMPAQERRNLRGGRMLRRFDSYLAHLDGRPQDQWLRQPLARLRARHGNRAGPGVAFVDTVDHVRQVWGVGRQAGFEWAEFLAKVTGFPLEAPDAQLWDSEGPRRALQRLYGNPAPSRGWLEDRAHECRSEVEAATGLRLPWEDFETAICDFNVMRDGRYYPGKHLGMLRAELDAIPDPDVHATAMGAWREAIPAPWADTAPGAPKALQVQYRDTGRMVTRPCVT